MSSSLKAFPVTRVSHETISAFYPRDFFTVFFFFSFILFQFYIFLCHSTPVLPLFFRVTFAKRETPTLPQLPVSIVSPQSTSPILLIILYGPTSRAETLNPGLFKLYLTALVVVRMSCWQYLHIFVKDGTHLNRIRFIKYIGNIIHFHSVQEELDLELLV